MNYKIKKGDSFLCIQDYLMDAEDFEEGANLVAYKKGNGYTSDRDGNLPSEMYIDHEMEGEENFGDYFELIGSVVYTSTEPDKINPDHYRNGKIECIDAIESATVNKTGIEAVCTANVIKYLWRYEAKNGIEDVAKALWYLNKLLKYLEDGKSISKV